MLLSHNPTIRAIANPVQREILDVLLTWRSLSTKILARHIVANRQGTTSPDSATVTALYTELIHRYLPELETVGLLEWERETGTVETTTHPAFSDPRFELVLDIDMDGLDEALLGVSQKSGRIALTELRDAQTLSRSDLATKILQKGDPSDPDPQLLEKAVVSLHHVQLPRLAELDLITYDPDAGEASYGGTATPALDTVFEVIYEPEKYMVRKYDGFLNGLRKSYLNVGPDMGEHADWPTFWSDPHHG